MFVCSIHLYTPICLYAPGVYTPSICPHTLLCLCVFGDFACCEGCNGLPLCWDTFPYITPIWGCLPLITPPHTQSLVPCASVCFRDISMLCGHFPSVEGFGVFPLSVGGLGASALEMSYAHSCTFFVVYYVSHFDYSSDYYSSSYSGIFWLVFCVIHDSGSFPDRVASKLGSAWHGSTTTLLKEGIFSLF